MKLLIVEDDETLCKAMAFQLKQSGIQTEVCHSGDEAYYRIMNAEYDIVILDRMLPEMDGLTVLKKIRTKGIKVPTIMVTALGGVEDRIGGLEGGADDYLVKPFEMRELIARVKALARRPMEYRTKNQMLLNDLCLDLDSKVLTYHGKQCELTVREAQLLEYLLRNRNQTIPRDLLISRVWGIENDITESNLDNYIYFIRRRLASVDTKVRIVTVRGIGYRLEES